MGYVKKHDVHRVANYFLLILFPIWWLVPSAFILGDVFFGVNLEGIGVIFIAILYNMCYPFVLGCCNKRGTIPGPICSCEMGFSGGCNLNELPPKTDAGFGITLWMRPLFSLAVIVSSRAIGWIFAPFWSGIAFLVGIGIELGFFVVGWFLSCIWSWVFTD